MKIVDLTNYLKKLRADYQTEYNAIEERLATGMRRLDSDYIKGSPSYNEELKEIKFQREVGIVGLQGKTAKAGTEKIQEMREQELSGIGRIDEVTVGKINALRGIPLSKTELQEICKKYAQGGNYWTQKAIAALAEENGVEAADLGLSSTIDTRLSILNQLQEQLDSLIENYSTDSQETAAVHARLLYLNDDILKRANDYFEGRSNELSEADTASRAYITIINQNSRMAQAIQIGNALRNLKGKDARNQLLYQLSQNTEIEDRVYAVAGADVLGEIRQWKERKASLYAQSVKMVDSLRYVTDKESAKSAITGYRSRLQESGVAKNEFFEASLKDLQRSNTVIMDAVAELGGVRMEDAPEMEVAS